MFIRVNHLRKNVMYDLPITREEYVEAGIKHGDFVIMYFSEQGREEVGKIVFSHDFETVEYNAPKLLRKAHEEDLKKIARLQEDEKKAFFVFAQKILQYQLPMQPVAVFFSFDEKFGDFLYTAPDRVDFRDLVKDLNRQWNKRLFLEQIGARDRSAVVDGCGSCGRKLCCSTFLKDRPPVTMTAIRGQELHYKDREKLTGLCGKLKCCLNYELDVYEQLAKAFPPLYSEVRILSKNMSGTVVSRSILDQQVRVRPKEGHPMIVPLTDIQVIKKAKYEEKKTALESTLSES